VISGYTAIRGEVSEFTEAEGESGIFQVYSRHMRGRVGEVATALIPEGGVAGVVSGVVYAVGGMCQATTWMLRFHPWYSLLFFPGLLLIWACAGGMICRMAAVDFARGETISPREAFGYVRRHYWGGFLLAPLAPAIGIVFIGLLLVVGGLILAIPYLGDILGGLFFFLALGAGLAVAVLWVGWSAGGILFWPAVAVEGSSSFDAFATSFHYVYTRPWRAALYGLVAFVYGAICWLVVYFFAHLTLLATHTFVGIGASVASSTVDGAEVAKLNAIWPYVFLGRALPEASWPTAGDAISGVLIYIWVAVVIGLVWSFLVSYFYSAGTAIYFLLRRAVDLTDYEQIEEIEEYVHEAPGPGGEAPPETPAPAAEAPPETPSDAETPGPPPSSGSDAESGPKDPTG
jgi:hypothetical protein